MKKHFKYIVKKNKNNEHFQDDFDFEADDLTDEIERSLLELRHFLKIPDSEISDAIKSRRAFRKKD
jgi:hypothetical protein